MFQKEIVRSKMVLRKELVGFKRREVVKQRKTQLKINLIRSYGKEYPAFARRGRNKCSDQHSMLTMDSCVTAVLVGTKSKETSRLHCQHNKRSKRKKKEI